MKEKLNHDQKALALWAAKCAGHVLSYFEKEYPEDDRPRKAVEAARAWAQGKIKAGMARTAALAAHAAARDAKHPVAVFAARAAGHAAATAHVAGHAPHAANYAVKAAEAAGASRERGWQVQRRSALLLKHLPKSLWLVMKKRAGYWKGRKLPVGMKRKVFKCINYYTNI